MKDPDEDTPLVRQLRVANSRLFKVWYLTRYLQILAGLLALALLCFLGMRRICGGAAGSSSSPWAR